MKKPLFSVIIPTLNEEKFLPLLLQSLVDQSHKNFDVIVVDGKSRDKTVEVAKTFAKKVPHLEVLVSKKASLPLQRNMGAAQAKGDWYAFIDADSVLMPYFIERISIYIKENNPKVFTTWTQPDSKDSKDSIFTLLINLYIEATIQMKRPLTPGPLTVIHRDIFDSVGGYNEEHAFNEDVELGLRLFRSGITTDIIREALYIWSMRRMRHEGSMKTMQQYALSFFPILFRRPMKHMPGYVMGGQLYGKRKTKKLTVKEFEKKLKVFLREVFT